MLRAAALTPLPMIRLLPLTLMMLTTQRGLEPTLRIIAMDHVRFEKIRQIVYRLFADMRSNLDVFRTVKKTADSIGFILISLATFYIGYKNITYKGPG